MNYLIEKISLYIREYKIRKSSNYSEEEIINKINYISNFINKKTPHRIIDPELDIMIPMIKRKINELYKSKKVAKKLYEDILKGIKYHKRKNREFEKQLKEI